MKNDEQHATQDTANEMVRKMLNHRSRHGWVL